jgi:hypothetical protein
MHAKPGIFNPEIPDRKTTAANHGTTKIWKKNKY